MAILGGKVGDYEFHSIIGVIKGIINHKYDEDKKKIELRKLSAEADLAEQQALKQKLENIETMRRLQLSSVDAYAEPLATAAKNLAVQPSPATIIDITKILKFSRRISRRSNLYNSRSVNAYTNSSKSGLTSARILIILHLTRIGG